MQNPMRCKTPADECELPHNRSHSKYSDRSQLPAEIKQHKGTQRHALTQQTNPVYTVQTTDVPYKTTND